MVVAVEHAKVEGQEADDNADEAEPEIDGGSEKIGRQADEKGIHVPDLISRLKWSSSDITWRKMPRQRGPVPRLMR